ncbi:hypothetical protein K6V42_01220 [Streptococcus suis]|uniref:hypothetical protein n=1 Tax=Streptococcus suis TaxID=1307 RepID=UPI001C96CC44|nr:hypothetical protein [Streptococcus suis]MBY4980861.1 hypothetical protein [Streptococcus suis]MBY4991567.1 hypothetical protein [Streptococcus suis]MBY5006969.1 hypothetical protein [Streptococcus suis]
MKKTIIALIFSGLILTACDSKTNETTTSSSQTSSTEQIEESSTNSSSSKNEGFQMVPYDEVHEFKNAIASRGTLDDQGIYRYDFLNEDDAVYDAMSYEEVEDIYPVQEQEEIEITLGTNFTIDDYNFNLANVTENTLYKNILGEEEAGGLLALELENGEAEDRSLRLPSQIGEVIKPIDISYTVINTEKRAVSVGDARIKRINVGHYGKTISKTKENLGARVAYEGINLFITRTQFIENVKINNPIFHDENFYYNKEYNKEFKNVSISYILDAGADGDISTENDNSIVTFKFVDEQLMSIELDCTDSYLNLEVE